MKQFFSTNRPAAIAVLAIVILLSVFGGVNRSVAALAAEVEDLYLHDRGDSVGLRSDLMRFVTYGENLYAIAEALGCGDTSFDGANKALRAALDSPFGTPLSTEEVFRAASLAYNRILALEDVPVNQKNSATSYFYEMQSARMRLTDNEAYRTAAEKYNDAIRSFPASVLSPGRQPAAIVG